MVVFGGLSKKRQTDGTPCNKKAPFSKIRGLINSKNNAINASFFANSQGRCQISKSVLKGVSWFRSENSLHSKAINEQVNDLPVQWKLETGPITKSSHYESAKNAEAPNLADLACLRPSSHGRR